MPEFKRGLKQFIFRGLLYVVAEVLHDTALKNELCAVNANVFEPEKPAKKPTGKRKEAPADKPDKSDEAAGSENQP